MAPTISVLLPVFNGSLHLGEAIDSVLNQSFEDFELIICDDASEDDSQAICSRYARQDSRISFTVNEHRRGLFANYNQCLKRATGKYIKPFAQDDVLFSDALRALRRTLEDHHSVVLASCASKLIGERGEPLANAVWDQPPEAIPHFQPVPGSLVIRNSLMPVSNFVGEPVRVMFRRYVAGSGFDERYNHLGDLEYWLRILRLGSYFSVNQELCAFRKHTCSRTSVNMRKLLFAPEIVRLAEEFWPEAESAGIPREEYIEHGIMQIGEYVAYLSEIGELKESEIADPDQACFENIELNAAFRKLAFRSLRMIGRQQQYDSSPEDRQSNLVHLVRSRERALRNLLRSRSWRWTRFLRETKRHYSRQKFDEKLLEVMETHSIELAGSLQYLRYLRKMIIAIRRSASWHVTSPLRAQNF